VILVTHDWSLLELTCDRLWLVANGKVTPFEGDLDEYRQLALAERRQQRQSAEKPKSPTNANKAPPANLALLKKELKAAEETLAKATEIAKALEREAAMPSTYNDPRKAADLAKRQKAHAPVLEKAEALWMAAAEAMEKADAA
jgi:ATP-binding cassette subfamily F protein 3